MAVTREMARRQMNGEKWDTSKYVHLKPLGIRNAVIEECARRIEQEPHSQAEMWAGIVRALKTET